MPSLLTQAPADEMLRIRQLMGCVYGHALRLLDDWIGVDPGAPRYRQACEPRLSLIAMFPIVGSVEGVICLSADESPVSVIMHKLIGAPAPDEDQQVLLQETLVEVLNIIIGNATDSLRQQGLPIDVFPPYAGPAEDQSALFEQPAYIHRIDTTAGSMVLVFSTNGR